MDPKHSLGPDRIDYKETPGDLTDVHAAIEREHPEPSADVTPIPMWLTAVCGFAIACAGVYLGMFHGGFRGDVYNERYSDPDILFPQAKAGKAETPVGPKSLADQGKSVYGTICAACHGPSGAGTPGVFPPLDGSEWVSGSEKRLVGIILKGVAGPITVKGTPFTNAMPPQEGALSDEKIAAVASYVRANFGKGASEITAAKVASARAEFAARALPWSEADLKQIPDNATLEGGANPSGGIPAAGGQPDAAGSQAASADLVNPGGATPTVPTDPKTPTTKPGATTEPGTPNAAPAPAAAPAAPPAAAAAPSDAAGFIAYGQQNYMLVCGACHQPSGLGLPAMFPPLAKSPYVNGPEDRFAAMILKGNQGPYTIDGKQYGATPMPPLELALDDSKIAAIMTFVRQTFGNNAPAVNAETVAAARKKFASRTTSWTQPELDAWK